MWYFIGRIKEKKWEMGGTWAFRIVAFPSTLGMAFGLLELDVGGQEHGKEQGEEKKGLHLILKSNYYRSGL